MRTNRIISIVLLMLLLGTLNAEDLSLSKNDFANWKAEEQEASLKIMKEGEVSILNFKVTIDHTKDKKGNAHTEPHLNFNWPRIRYLFEPVINLGKYKNLQFEYKASISRKTAPNIPAFVNFYASGGNGDFPIELQKGDKGWNKVVVKIKDLLKKSKTSAADWSNLKYIQIGVAERNFINGEKIDIKLKNIRLSTEKAKRVSAPAAVTVLNLPFSKASGLKDQSKFANQCSLQGNAVLKDSEIVLDGKKSYVNCGKKKDLDLGEGDITILATVKLASTQTPRTGIVTKGAAADSDPGYAFLYRVPKKAFYFYVSDGTQRASFTSKEMVINDGKWHTVAVSLNRGNEVLFAVDGKTCRRKEQFIPMENISSSDRELLIGSWSKAHFLNGGIKNVIIIKKGYSAKDLSEMTR